MIYNQKFSEIPKGIKPDATAKDLKEPEEYCNACERIISISRLARRLNGFRYLKTRFIVEYLTLERLTERYEKKYLFK